MDWVIGRQCDGRDSVMPGRLTDGSRNLFRVSVEAALVDAWPRLNQVPGPAIVQSRLWCCRRDSFDLALLECSWRADGPISGDQSLPCMSQPRPWLTPLVNWDADGRGAATRPPMAVRGRNGRYTERRGNSPASRFGQSRQRHSLAREIGRGRIVQRRQGVKVCLFQQDKRLHVVDVVCCSHLSRPF